MSAVQAVAFDVLCELRDQVGESPVWSAREAALYWVDIEGRAIRRFDWATRATRSWQVAERIGCIALRAGGGLVAGMETGLFDIDLPATGAQALARLRVAVSHPREGMRFNDGRLDRAGRLWASTMVRDGALAAAEGVLLRLDGRGLSDPQVTGLVTGNGLAFSPDNAVMYLSDSHPSVQRVWAFDLDAGGVPTNRRLFIDMTPLPGRPDGAAVDTDGCYWICGNDAARCIASRPTAAWTARSRCRFPSRPCAASAARGWTGCSSPPFPRRGPRRASTPRSTARCWSFARARRAWPKPSSRSEPPLP